VPTFQFCANQKEAYETIATYTRSDFRKKVILESLPPIDFRQDNRFSQETNSKLKFISYRPNKIEIEVSTNQKGFLVLSDNYHPGWEARVDGKEVKVLRANYIMRAIPIRTGDHKVVFMFRPNLLISGMFFTVIGWIVLAVLIGKSLIKREKR